jgi:putative transposase
MVGVGRPPSHSTSKGPPPVKKDYQTTAVPTDLAMPDAVTVAMGDLAETVREGLLALAVGAGLQVIQVMMQESVTAVCGPKGAHDPERTALRHGSEEGSVTLGGRRVPVRRPRVRTADGTSEVAVPAYDLFRLPSCWANWRWSG